MSKPGSSKKVLEDTQKLNRPKTGIFKASELPGADSLEYITMPDWWVKGTNTKGLPFKKYVVIAGDSDSGKTSFSIESIKAAQSQGVKCLYVETEGKTTKQDFLNWGVDVNELDVMSDSIVENIYEEACGWIDSNKDQKMLVILDSIGNVISMHDADRSMVDSNQKPGGKGKTNREGLNKLISKRAISDVALVLISYTYDNMGSPGKTNAGGKAVNFFSCLTYQTNRKSWIEKTVKGEKIRVGAKVQWKLFKNHIDRSNPGPKVIELDITAEGISLAGVANE